MVVIILAFAAWALIRIAKRPRKERIVYAAPRPKRVARPVLRVVK